MKKEYKIKLINSQFLVMKKLRRLSREGKWPRSPATTNQVLSFVEYLASSDPEAKSV